MDCANNRSIVFGFGLRGGAQQRCGGEGDTISPRKSAEQFHSYSTPIWSVNH
jgi:hypothetical protein